MDTYVELTAHARSRARKRFPGLSNAAMIDEVLGGIREGRMATKLPRWAVQEGRRRGRLQHSGRVVWEQECRRVYVISRRPRHITVITVIDPAVPIPAGDE